MEKQQDGGAMRGECRAMSIMETTKEGAKRVQKGTNRGNTCGNEKGKGGYLQRQVSSHGSGSDENDGETQKLEVKYDFTFTPIKR